MIFGAVSANQQSRSANPDAISGGVGRVVSGWVLAGKRSWRADFILTFDVLKEVTVFQSLRSCTLTNL